MKKHCVIGMVMLLCFSLAACGRRNNKPEMTIIPTIDPTITTNIPDPDVDTQMPIFTEGTDPTNWTDPAESTGATTSEARRGH